MTEPAVASSDARNIETSIARDGDDYVINGRKWWTSGASDPRCKVLIVMGRTNPEAASHQQQSMVLVPIDTPGVTIVRSTAGVRLARPARPLRDHLRQRPGARPEPARRGRVRFRDRPGPARPRPDPPLHARAGRGRTRAGVDGRPRAQAGGIRQAAGRPGRGSGVDRQVAQRDRPGPAAVREGRVDHRPAWQQGRPPAGVARSRPSRPRWPATSSTARSRCTARPGSATTPRWRGCTAWHRAMRIFDGPDEVHMRTIARAEIGREKSAFAAAVTQLSMPNRCRSAWNFRDVADATGCAQVGSFGPAS